MTQKRKSSFTKLNDVTWAYRMDEQLHPMIYNSVHLLNHGLASKAM